MGMDLESWHHGPHHPWDTPGPCPLSHGSPAPRLPHAFSVLCPPGPPWSLTSSVPFLRENLLLTGPRPSFVVCKARWKLKRKCDAAFWTVMA